VVIITTAVVAAAIIIVTAITVIILMIGAPADVTAAMMNCVIHQKVLLCGQMTAHMMTTGHLQRSQEICRDQIIRIFPEVKPVVVKARKHSKKRFVNEHKK